MAALNLLTDFEETLAAMGMVERDAAWFRWQRSGARGSTVSSALQFLEEVADFCSGVRGMLAFAVSGSRADLWIWIVAGDGGVRFGRRSGDSSVELAGIAERAAAHGFPVINWQPP